MQEQTSTIDSSPSPSSTASKTAASGSQFQAEGPPARTIGSSSSRSALVSAMPARSSVSRTLVAMSSWASVKPMASKEASGAAPSSESSGTPCSRMSPAMSFQGR